MPKRFLWILFFVAPLRSSRFMWLVSLTLNLFTSASLSLGATGDLPKPEEVFAKALKKMSEPGDSITEIKSTTDKNRNEKTIYYRRINSDGTLETKVIIEPQSHKRKPTIMIQNAQGQWSVFENLALKLEFLHNLYGENGGVVDVPQIKVGNDYNISDEVVDNIPCYRITETISKQAIEAAIRIVKNNPALNGNIASSQLPATNMYWIEKADYTLYQRTTYLPSGVVLNSDKYLNIKTNVPLSSDFFEVPQGLPIKKVATIKEYTEALRSVFRPSSVAVVKENPRRLGITVWTFVTLSALLLAYLHIKNKKNTLN